MNSSFEFYDLPHEIKNIIFHKNREKARTKRDIVNLLETFFSKRIQYAYDANGQKLECWNCKSTNNPIHTSAILGNHRNEYNGDYCAKFCREAWERNEEEWERANATTDEEESDEDE